MIRGASGAAAVALAVLALAVPAARGGTPADVGATGASGPAPATLSGPYPGPSPKLAYVAEVVVATQAREQPSVYSRIEMPIATSSLWVHGPVELLVLGSAIDPAGRLWLDVRLPTRPNDASAWIPANDTIVTHTAWRVVVELAARRLDVLRGGVVVHRFGVVIGKRATPTPTGLFAIYAKAPQPPGSELGPWALHLTAHSNVLTNYGGGPGRVAIHGRAGPLLADPIGSARSHGCIRTRNANISWLAARLPLGTPVLVVR
jgi:lipoprotein-anchoring transpeptidase ErfK/SrfK